MAVSVQDPNDTQAALQALAANSLLAPTLSGDNNAGVYAAGGDGGPSMKGGPNSTQQQAAQEALNAQTQQYNTQVDKTLSPYVQQVISDLNSNNFAGAWQTADSTAAAFGQGSSNKNVTQNSSAQDPLMAALESNQGLQALDPSKQWTGAEDQAYYKAFAGSDYNQAVLGANSSGLWGSNGAAGNGTDAAANIAQEGNTPDVARFAGQVPTSNFVEKYGGDILGVAIGAMTFGAGAPAATAMMAGTASADAANGNIVGAALAGLGIGIPGLTGTLSSELGGGALGAIGAGATVGAGTGALTGALTGGNIGKDALIGGVGGGLAGGVGYGLGPEGAGLSTGLANGIGKVGGSLASTGLGNALQGGNNGMSTNGGQSVALNPGATMSPGYIAPGTVGPSSTGAVGTSGAGGLAAGLSGLFGGGPASSSVLSGLAGLGSTIAGGISNSNIASMQNNAYTTAGNAANSGNSWGVNGIGGMGAQFNNGQLNINGGSLNPLASGFSSFGQNQLNTANALGSGNPREVINGYNNYMGQLGGAQSLAGQGQQSGLNMMNSGSNMFNSAGTNYNSAYNTSLNSGLAALNPAIQQQSNALLNSNFERGQAGTSGGALQTQALQNSFNTADLQVQNNAVSQGINAMNTTGNLGLGAYSQGAGQLGNFNNQSASLGQQGLSAGENYSMFQPQLVGAYQSNAQNAVSGVGGINQMGLQNAQVGLAGQTNVGNQMNQGARTQGSISTANTLNGGTSGYLSSMLGGLSGNLLGGAGGGLAGLFGGGSSGGGLGSLFGGTSAMAGGLLSGNNYYGSPSATNAGIGYSNQYLNGQNTLGQGSLSPVGGTDFLGGNSGYSSPTIDTGDMGDTIGGMDFGDF